MAATNGYEPPSALAKRENDHAQRDQDFRRFRRDSRRDAPVHFRRALGAGDGLHGAQRDPSRRRQGRLEAVPRPGDSQGNLGRRSARAAGEPSPNIGADTEWPSAASSTSRDWRSGPPSWRIPRRAIAKSCVYFGGCKATFVDDPGAAPIPPKVEIRKLAPKPRLKKPIFDKRSGWTYYLQEDRNTGEIYIQIEDASGADVHIDGEIPLPGGGPLYPVR